MKRRPALHDIWWLCLLVVLSTPMSAAVTSTSASAQGWSWPWETQTRRPRPRRQPRYEPPPSAPAPSNSWNTEQKPPAYGTRRGSVCLQLERQLARQANGSNNHAQRMAELDSKARATRSNLRRSEIELDRRNCYETFFFSRTLRRTRRCVNLARQVSRLENELKELEIRLNQAQSGSPRSRQDEIIRELASNNCGAEYVREAARRSSTGNFWQDLDGSGDRIRGNTFAGLPFATYRTLCVRLCDGYYFPVSFSTLPTHFSRDANACETQCAAPTELFFHQNPGGSVAGMVSQKNRRSYTSLKTAFRYRKEFVPGCSCKQSEFIPNTGANYSPRKARLERQKRLKAPPIAPKRDNFSPIR